MTGQKNRRMRRRITLFVFLMICCFLFLSSAALGILYKLNLFPGLWLPIIAFGTSTILGTAIADFYTKRTLRPLEKLILAMKEVAAGNFSVRVDETTRNPDFRELLASFNLMATELKSTELFKTDFIDTFSHELKTPVVSIRGFAKRLKLKTLSEEQRQEYVDIIINESERLVTMASNILLLSKFENQQIITGKQVFSLDEQLRSCILLLDKSWREKDIEWELDLPRLDYYANPGMLEHVWLNLLMNAVKFSYPGGTIAVKAWEDGENVGVSVSDGGKGMTQETQEHIFDRFYQADAAHVGCGNGLGLSLVKRVVQLCRGRVLVQSKPEQGARFTVLLPQNGEDAAKARGGPLRKSEAKGRNADE